MVRVVKTGFGYLMWHKTDLGYLKHDVLIGRSAKTGFECPIVLRIGLDQFGRFHDICWKPILSVPSQLKVFLGLLLWLALDTLCQSNPVLKLGTSGTQTANRFLVNSFYWKSVLNTSLVRKVWESEINN